MARFAATIRFTAQGIGTIQDTTRRAAAFKGAAKKLGIKVVELYWSLGPFDGLIIFEAPDSQVATAAMLSLAAQGNVQTRTAEIFTAADMEQILQCVKQ
jgi:uncharacterized protein with GYD domain